MDVFRLGAVHDGTFYNNVDARMCPAEENNIMTPLLGAFNNANAMFYFSQCSIAAFKSTLLTPDMMLGFLINYFLLILFSKNNFLRNLTKAGQCLYKSAGRLSLEFQKVYGSQVLPGLHYSADDQCKLAYGPLSHFCNGVSCF